MKYVVMRLNEWKRMEAVTPMRLPIAGIGKSCGLLLVYDTLDDLVHDYPDAEYVTIEAKGGEGRCSAKSAIRKSPTKGKRAVRAR